MGVYVSKENRVKRSRAKKGASVKSALSKSAFVYKTKNGGKNYQRTVNDRVFAKGASKEVMVKITGSAKTKQGVKNAIDYISRDGDVPLQDYMGNQYDSVDAPLLKKAMIDNSDPTRATNEQGKANYDITKNVVFSPPITAKVKPEEALDAVRNTLNKKYPDSRFVLAYHDDKKEHPHVHAVVRLRGDTDKPISLKKEDLRELRTGFSRELQSMGYDVQATHKQKQQENAQERKKGAVYEVVKFGNDHYQFKPENSYQNYITVKTLNKGVESTFWGKELGELCQREKLAKGDLVRIKKVGAVDVEVPEVDQSGKQIGSKKTKRNQWELQNLGLDGIDRTQPLKSNVELNTPEQLSQKRLEQAKFRQDAADMLRKEKSVTIGVSIG